MTRSGSLPEIWSDNGTNFKDAEEELKSAFKLLNENHITRTFTSAATSWHFIPTGSHFPTHGWSLGAVSSVNKAGP